ncbi:unnamed protein product [Rhizophagus irregularis]|nr:unnamed protein product [Rhizophagus irregularis]
MESNRDKCCMRDNEVWISCNLCESFLCWDHKYSGCEVTTSFISNISELAHLFIEDESTDSTGQDASMLLTERELYQMILPVPELDEIKSFNTTKSASRKVSDESVRLWSDFLADAFNASSSLDASNRIFKKLDPVTLEDSLSVEDSVIDMFLETMKSINNQRLILLPKPERWETIVEIKPEQLMRHLLDDGLDLHEAYNRAVTLVDDGTTTVSKYRRVIRIVRQTFGYMVVNDLRHGLLTTYIRTWFFYHDRNNPNITYISPAVLINQNHTSTQASFLECMFYHETLSTRDLSSPSIDSDEEDNNDDDNDKADDNGEGDDRKDDTPYKAKSRSKRKWETLNVTTRSMSKKKKQDDNKGEKLEDMKNYERSQFSFGDVLGSGRSGVVFVAELYGKVGALKMVDLYKNEYLLQEILNEIKIYLGPLMDIQCIYIPELLEFGILQEAFVFILTSLSGKSFARLDDVTEREKTLAIEGLQAIHARGVLHGDVKLENIMVNRSESISKSRVQWIDFAWSKMGRNSKDFNRELIELKSLLGMKGNSNS